MCPGAHSRRSAAAFTAAPVRFRIRTRTGAYSLKIFHMDKFFIVSGIFLLPVLPRKGPQGRSATQPAYCRLFWESSPDFPDSEKAFVPDSVSGSEMNPWSVPVRFHLTGHPVFLRDFLVFQTDHLVFRMGHPVFRTDFLILPLESSTSSAPARP